jgi:hypothetical protein
VQGSVTSAKKSKAMERIEEPRRADEAKYKLLIPKNMSLDKRAYRKLRPPIGD